MAFFFVLSINLKNTCAISEIIIDRIAYILMHYTEVDMNIQIGDNTFNQKNQLHTNDYANYTYSKDSLYNNEFVKDKGKTDKLTHVTGADAVYSGNGSSFSVPVEEDRNSYSLSNIPDSTMQKNYMVVMSNTLSEEDYSNLSKEGFHLGDMEAGEMVTIVDRIKTTMAKSGQVVEGYNDDLDKETLEAITGSAVYAQAIAASFADNNVPMTKANVSETVNALDMAGKLMPIDNETVKYMLSEKMIPSIENIYMAQHSGASVGSIKRAEYYVDNSGYVNKSAETQDMKYLEDSIKNIIESAGYESNQDNMSMAKDMVSSGIALTQEAFDIYSELKAIELPVDVNVLADRIASTIADGKRPSEAGLLEKETLLDKANRLVDEVSSITDDAVKMVVAEDKPLTIRSLVNSGITPSNNDKSEDISDNNSQNLLTARRLVAEIRLSMTVSSTYVLLKNNISVDTSELSLLVDELKEAENRQFESVFGKEFVADKERIASLFDETTSKVSELRDMPVAAIGRFAFRSSTSLNMVYEESASLAREYKAASLEYEKMFTEVRADLGDSIKKAFRNAEDILGEMGMEKSEDNTRAVRVLGYNQMEISRENISIIKDATDKVQSVIEKMHPSNTLELIRQGINPLEVDMDELENHLNKMESTDNEPERFSVFLNKLDEAGKITPEERESYIGIYRLINQIEKNDSAAIGTLINSNADINFKNLLSAVRTGKHKGIDIKVDDNNGEIMDLITKGISISDQINKAFSDKAMAEDIRAIRNMDGTYQEVKDYLENMGIRSTVDNMLATKSLSEGNSKIYKDIKKNIKASKLPEFGDITSRVLQEFNDKDSAINGFEEMSERLKDLVNTESLDITNTINLKEMSFSLKQLFVATRFSHDEYYEVPMNIGDEVSSVSIRITHGDDKGVSISFSSEMYGSVSGRFRPYKDGYDGLFQVDGSGEDSLDSMKDTLIDALREQNLNVIDIKFAGSSSVNLNILTDKSDNNSSDVDNSVSTAEFYKLAKVFIETLSR